MGSNSSIPLSCFCRRRLACEGDAIEKNKSEKEKKKKKNLERRGGMKMEEEKEQQE